MGLAREYDFVNPLLLCIALGGTVIIYMIIGLALFLPGLALTVRRLRDAGFHWALIFVGFVPFVGSIALLVLLAMPTKETLED